MAKRGIEIFTSLSHGDWQLSGDYGKYAEAPEGASIRKIKIEPTPYEVPGKTMLDMGEGNRPMWVPNEAIEDSHTPAPPQV